MATGAATAPPAATLPDRLTMRACVLREPSRPVATETVTLDPPRAGEVLVRIVAAGVCHSDVQLADGELGTGRWPMVLGHEGAGVVEAVGAEVDRSRRRRPRRLPSSRPAALSGVPLGPAHAVRAGRRLFVLPAPCWTAPRGYTARPARRSSTA